MPWFSRACACYEKQKVGHDREPKPEPSFVAEENNADPSAEHMIGRPSEFTGHPDISDSFGHVHFLSGEV
jgi:hypothetical protein